MQFEISEQYYRILQASLNHFIPKNIIPPDRIKNLQTKLKYQHDNATENVVIIERTQHLIESLKSIHNEISSISK